MIISPLVCDSKAEKHHPPGAILCLYKIAMSHPLNPVGLPQTVGVGQYRIERTGLIRSIQIPAPADGDTVHVFGSTLTQHQIIITIFLVYVGSFREASADTSPDKTLGSHCLTGFQIDFGNTYAFISLRDKIGASVVVPENIGINAVDIDPYGFTPGSGRICGRTIKISSSAHIGAYHIEQPVMKTQ